jgi:hypothetical protein
MQRNQMGRFLRVFTPFTLLLVGLLILNYRIENSPTSQITPEPISLSNTQQPTPSETVPSSSRSNRPETIATAIINATAMPTLSTEPTPQPTPTLLPGDFVTLIGPPGQSRFSLSTPLNFYWFANRALSEGESFAVYLVNGNEESLVGEISEPNLGTAYQVDFLPQGSGLPAADYNWLVKIVDQEKDVVLGESERRPITLIETDQ